MASTYSIAHLGGLIKAKRREKDLRLRDAAAESGISASTLSRLERGISETMPDTETLKSLSEWLGISISDLVDEKRINKGGKVPKLATTEQVEVYLRADKNLSTESANALASAFKELYKLYSSSPFGRSSGLKRKKTGG